MTSFIAPQKLSWKSVDKTIRNDWGKAQKIRQYDTRIRGLPRISAYLLIDRLAKGWYSGTEKACLHCFYFVLTDKVYWGDDVKAHDAQVIKDIVDRARGLHTFWAGLALAQLGAA